jgi:hypothetical protein
LAEFFSQWKWPSFGLSSGRSSTPIIAVIDNTSVQTQDKIDIDGDGVGDIAHGLVCALYAQKKKPGAKLWMLDSEARIPEMANAYESTRIGCEGRIQALNKVAQQIQQGTSQIEAVNMSLSTAETTFSELGQAIGMDLSPAAVQQANPRQLKTDIRRRLDHLVNQSELGPLPEVQYRYAQFGKVLQAMERITSQGVKIYVAAGNEGPGHLNIYSLAEGARTVAAVNARGEKTAYTADTGGNPFITDWVQGDYNVKAVVKNGQVEGYNLTGGNQVEVSRSQVSGQGRFINPTLRKFQNTPLENVLIRPSEVSLLRTNGLNAHGQRVVPDLMNRVFPVNVYGQLKGLSGEAIQKMKSQGDYTTWDGSWTFRKDANGRLNYNPEGSSTRSSLPVVNVLRGTSYASPSAIT